MVWPGLAFAYLCVCDGHCRHCQPLVCELHHGFLRRAVCCPGRLSESHLCFRGKCFSPIGEQAKGLNVSAKPSSFSFASRCATRGQSWGSRSTSRGTDTSKGSQSAARAMRSRRAYTRCERMSTTQICIKISSCLLLHQCDIPKYSLRGRKPSSISHRRTYSLAISPKESMSRSQI